MRLPESSTLNIKQRVNGTITLLGSAQVTLNSTTNFRTDIFGTNLWVYVNGALVIRQTLPSATIGMPGIGGTMGSIDADVVGTSRGPGAAPPVQSRR